MTMLTFIRNMVAFASLPRVECYIEEEYQKTRQKLLHEEVELENKRVDVVTTEARVTELRERLMRLTHIREVKKDGHPDLDVEMVRAAKYGSINVRFTDEVAKRLREEGWLAEPVRERVAKAWPTPRAKDTQDEPDPTML